MVVQRDSTDVDDADDPTLAQIQAQASYTSVGASASVTPLTYGYVDAPLANTTYSKDVTFTKEKDCCLKFLQT